MKAGDQIKLKNSKYGIWEVRAWKEGENKGRLYAHMLNNSTKMIGSGANLSGFWLDNEDMSNYEVVK